MQPITYETTDIYISSVLVTLGYAVDVEKKMDSRNSTFIFYLSSAQDLVNIQNTVNAYWQHNLTVDPCELFSNYKALRGKVLWLKRFS